MTPIQAILDYVNIHEIPHHDIDGDIVIEGNNSVQKQSTPNSKRCIPTDCSPKKSSLEKKKEKWGDTPSWQNADDVNECNFCSAAFTFLNRKHHCRRCGLVVCASCSASRVPLPSSARVITPGKGHMKSSNRNDDVEQVRVCDTCVNLLNLTFK